MKSLVFAVLSSFSLAACAQSADPQAASGQKISVGSNTPAATKPIAEPAFAAGSPEARVRGVLKELNPKIRADSSISHSEAGVLSTVIELPASREP